MIWLGISYQTSGLGTVQGVMAVGRRRVVMKAGKWTGLTQFTDVSISIFSFSIRIKGGRHRSKLPFGLSTTPPVY